MTYKLFLDDERDPIGQDWIIVRSYDDFALIIEEFGVPEFISFDHDLGENSATGYACAKWLVGYCIGAGEKIPDFYVHSQNPVGKANIEAYISSAKRYMEP